MDGSRAKSHAPVLLLPNISARWTRQAAFRQSLRPDSGVDHTGNSNTEAWTVGNSSATFHSFTLEYPTELQWNADSVNNTNRVNLNDLSLLSNARRLGIWQCQRLQFLCFCVIKMVSGALSPVPALLWPETCWGFSAVSTNEAWAVGVRARSTNCYSGNQRFTILKWNGSSDGTGPTVSPTFPAADNNNNQNLNHVAVIDTNGNGAGNLGFAVGNAGDILKSTEPTGRRSFYRHNNLFGVFIVLLLKRGQLALLADILKWNGATGVP